MATEASNLAEGILAQLGEGSVDVVTVLEPVELEELVTGAVGGTAAFNTIMLSTKAHLREQYELGLITGDQYTKAYIELTSASLQTALQFVLQRQQTFWQARLLRSQDALVKMQLATEDAKYRLLLEQTKMVMEQTEAQRAQTMDTRTNGTTPIEGSVGKQKDLYEQQITSYKRDGEQKLGRMLLDSWITQKTLDEGLVAPVGLQNAAIDDMLVKLRTNLDIA